MQQKQTVTLASGRKVEVAPLPYEAWEEMENQRLEALEKMAAMGEDQAKTAHLVALRMLRDLDRAVVQARVPDWEKLKKEFSHDEYLDLVNQLTERSAREAEPENLSAGGGGPQTPAGAGSAPPAAAIPNAGGGPSTAGAAATPSP